MVHVPEAQLVCLFCHTRCHTTEYSGQSLSSMTKESHLNWSVSESEMETGIDCEKKPLEPIPEGDVKAVESLQISPHPEV